MIFINLFAFLYVKGNSKEICEFWLVSTPSSLFKAWLLSEATFAVMASKHEGWNFVEISVYSEYITSCPAPLDHWEWRKARYHSLGLQSFQEMLTRRLQTLNRAVPWSFKIVNEITKDETKVLLNFIILIESALNLVVASILNGHFGECILKQQQ